MQSKILPTIIDVEASGFGAQSYPIEIGVVRYDGAKWCKLIRPFDSWMHWDSHAEALHGISRAMLQSQGVEPVHVCNELNALLGNTVVFSDGWVVDNPWLIKLFAAAQIEMTFTCRALEYILSEAQMRVWHEKKAIQTEQLKVQRHRATADALIIQRTYADTMHLNNTVNKF